MYLGWGRVSYWGKMAGRFPQSELTSVEAVLKALAHRRRLAILLALRRGPLHVGALAEELQIPLKTVSRNLRLLARAGMVLSEVRQGHAFYWPNPEAPVLGRAIIRAVEVRDR